ncbi:hypothetical protein GGR39_003236 [Novosphingobium fluoreni]|uniref:Uncharacterized protein n=1 Tax=Novosphingobium fluoreni TaxID=1391222 RepID=A0A7W6C142_9SPHN|nr:hypothetical protein [Novosphingobium fluoreni]MBB3941556.1 hypothetical protein [Novosphingobium fluoreni]
MAGDDIVDAEWEEVPNHGGNLHVAKPSHRSAQEVKSSASQASGTRGHQPTVAPRQGSIGLFFRGLWRVIVVVLGFMALLLIFVALVPAPGSESGSADEGGTSANQSDQQAGAGDGDAKQMLSDWSQAVTGKPSTIGFALIDGEGKPGEFCSSSTGNSLMNFGGRSLPPEHADMYTYFSWLPDKSDTGIVGFFTFDRAAGELLGHDLIQGNVATDRHHDIADKRFKVNPDGSGRVTIDGTRYHVCVL